MVITTVPLSLTPPVGRTHYETAGTLRTLCAPTGRIVLDQSANCSMTFEKVLCDISSCDSYVVADVHIRGCETVGHPPLGLCTPLPEAHFLRPSPLDCRPQPQTSHQSRLVWLPMAMEESMVLVPGAEGRGVDSSPTVTLSAGETVYLLAPEDLEPRVLHTIYGLPIICLDASVTHAALGVKNCGWDMNDGGKGEGVLPAHRLLCDITVCPPHGRSLRAGRRLEDCERLRRGIGLLMGDEDGSQPV
ncbi:uncharacterized protein LOC112262570 isoform X3 [Oncorhynchus tshawytscha]|uniref:uncharacterized protein LOC112262570 isoform X3 n=1 Tax=Oncorhynchus tshawytscha TaxID=74940 RepID=UPI001C3E3B97|nr:uncharacterized protein LOC112262570 isoform X3 [Oncorhynchus tshawytscha]